MAQSNGSDPRTAGGLPPQHPGEPNGQQDVQIDPRYGVQPGQPAETWSQQGQPVQHPDAPYGGQDPQTQQPVYHYPQGGVPDPQAGVPGGDGQHREAVAPVAQPVAGNGLPGQGVQPGQSAYAPQFAPYQAAAVDPFQPQQQHQQQQQAQVPGGNPAMVSPYQDEVPVTGEPYNPQAYAPTAPVGTPHTMDNPAFPQPAPGSFQDAQNAPAAAGDLRNSTYEDWQANAPAAPGAAPFGEAQVGGEAQIGGAAQVGDVHGFDAGGFAGAQAATGQPVGAPPVTGAPAPGQPDYLAQPEYGFQGGPQTQEPAGEFGAPGQPGEQFNVQPGQVQPGQVQPGGAYGEDPSLHHGDPTTGVSAGALGEPEAGYEDDEYGDQFEETSGGGMSRTLLIVGVLVGAIVVGGGLAYGWKMISGSGGGKVASTPVVRDSQSPRKSRPASPGGQQFAHRDAKIMGRLGDGGSRAAGTNADGTRRVATVPVTRDGRLVAPVGEPSVSVPGLTVVDAFGAGQPPQPTARAPSAGNPIVVVPPSGTAKPRVKVDTVRTAPVVISKRATTPTLRPAGPAKKAAPVVVNTPTAPVKKKVVRAPTTPTAPRVTPPSSGGASGYVAVLASVPVSGSSEMNALMQYADLQQKYGTILTNKTPDVREVNLGAKGRYHRLLVGPPGSRTQASNLCAKLKGAGYSGCWVTSF